MPEAPVERLAAQIQELARGLAATVPPPRALPWLGLEHASGTGFHLLHALSARGIFRKYERVLDLGADLGATSRWLAVELGCEVIGTAADAAVATAANELTRRAGLAAQVRLLPAAAGALPFPDATFTHVWILETLPRLADPRSALAEAHRTLRRGGLVGVQDLVLGDGAATRRPVPGWHPSSVAAREAALRTAGFVDLETRDRTDEASETSAQVLAARRRLLGRLRAAGDPALAALAAEREAVARALADGTLRVVQILARRA
jgi:SAM-dependent methyltransferase